MSKDGYIEFVMSMAMDQGKFFFLDSGEGNDFYDKEKDWYIEDLSGWLIDTNDIDKFMVSMNENTAYDDFSEQYVFVKWIRLPNNSIEIEFKKY